MGTKKYENIILQEDAKSAPFILKHLNTVSLNTYLISKQFFTYG